MKRVHVKIGDIFSVAIDTHHQKFFQYIANDTSQLTSSVIRAFKKTIAKGETLDWDELAREKIDFYAHVFIKNGVKLGFWQKVGHAANMGLCDVFFRNSNDYGNPKVTISENWHIWKINQPFIHIGKLEGEYQKAEIGVVVTPNDIIHRMKTGKYNFFFPSF